MPDMTLSFLMVSYSGRPPRKYIIKTIRWSCVKSISFVVIRWFLRKGHRFDHNFNPRKVIPEMTLSYMLNGRHRECIGLVTHGPVNVAFMCDFRSILCHEVSDHIKGRAF